MSYTFITSTPKESIHALAFQGITASSCYEQIRDMLGRKFGDQFVLLFAKPAENGDQIDWYSPVQGLPQKLEALPEEEQNRIRLRLGQMGAEIERYADELIHNGDPLKFTRGRILALALSYPDDGSIFVIGGQPVFTAWGFGPGTPGVEAQKLTRIAPIAKPVSAPPPEPPQSAQAPSEPPAPEPAKRSGCIAAPGCMGSYGCLGLLAWLLPLFGLALLILLLFSGFGGLPALSGKTLWTFPNFLNVPSLALEIDQANGKYADLLARANSLAAQCPGKAYAPKSAKPEQLQIPKNASDTSFLEGRWRCETGLANQRTGEAVAFEFAFDRTGEGQGTVFESNDQCTGKARTDFKNGVLHIALDKQQCKKSGKNYLPVNIECRRLENNVSECVGVNNDGTRWDADFKKLD